MERTIAASEFRQQCLALLDLVDETGVTLIVTKRGRPVARVLPVGSLVPGSAPGGIRILTDLDEELFSVREAWSAADR